MKIKDVREKFPEYKISYLNKKDYLVGITDTKIKKRREDLYEEVFIASNNRKFYLLYPSGNNFTGSFKNKNEAVNWFKNGGR